MMWKCMSKRTLYSIKQMPAQGMQVSVAATVETLMNYGVIQPMARAVKGVGKWATLSEYAKARWDRCQMMIEDTEQYMTCQDDDKKRWQHKNWTWEDQAFSIFIASDQ